MTHVTILEDSHHQHHRGFTDGIDRAFDVIFEGRSAEERSAAEQSARAAQRLAVLGEMTGGIAHDFRNLLAIIDSSLRLAKKHSEQPEKVRSHIAAAQEGIDRGVKLTSQLLTFVKRRELEARMGDANELLRDLELFLKYGAGPGIRIILELAPDIPRCLIEPSQFNAAVLNLVINARDAMPIGGEIQISTARRAVRSVISDSPAPGTYVQVRVKDSGQGMPEDIVQRIFDPFFTTKGEKGTGLGLPQVRDFMWLIGGYVSVTSEPGFGTTIDLLFPSAESR